MHIRLPTLRALGRDAKLLVATAGALAVSFYGLQMLLKVLYVIRLNHGPEYIGWFGAASALTYMGMGIPSGALGSRFGTRRIMLLGAITTVLGMALLPLTESVPFPLQSFWPFISQIVLTGGWSLYNVNLVPALTAATASENRAQAYALSNTLIGLGTFVGTVSGGMLPGLFAGLLGQSLDVPEPYRLALWVGTALGLAAIIPLSLVGSIHRTVATDREVVRGPFPVLLIFLMIAYIYLRHAGWATCQAFCNAYMDTILRMPAASIGLVTGAGQFVAILAPLATPQLAARRSNGWTLIVSTLGLAASLLPLALLPHWTAAAAGRLGIVVLSAIWMPALQAFQMDLVDSRWRPLAYGALSMGMGLGFGSTSLAGGYIIGAWGYGSLFLLGSGLSVVAAVVMWGVLRSPAVRGT